jgi:arylsulfatase
MARALYAALALRAAAAAPTRPNILLLMADQMRFDTLTPELTPALSSLADSGLRFARTYTSTPSCTPARSALLTGLSPWYHGMLGYGDVAPAWPFEMPRAMGALGYSTAVVGKNHYCTFPCNTSARRATCKTCKTLTRNLTNARPNR